jgi:hypothetical protein
VGIAHRLVLAFYVFTLPMKRASRVSTCTESPVSM